MQACSTLNIAASLVLVTLISFAGCGGQQPEAASPATAAKTSDPSAGTEEDPATPSGKEEGAGTDGANPEGAGGEGSGDKGGDAETRTTEVIQKLVQDNRKPVRECYEKARKQIPDLKGTMTIHFVLDPEGKVKEAVLNVEKSEVKSPDVVSCAVAVLKKIKFPPSSRGMESTVNYPFTFNP
ncbi:MAG: AgmX/PglI C-terminal domain-containing protein [Myxococcales bacterium]|nr:AgmX/PglI C-terminal domain-containing protein [Myxococcales bacterium]